MQADTFNRSQIQRPTSRYQTSRQHRHHAESPEPGDSSRRHRDQPPLPRQEGDSRYLDRGGISLAQNLLSHRGRLLRQENRGIE